MTQNNGCLLPGQGIVLKPAGPGPLERKFGWKLSDEAKRKIKNIERLGRWG